MKFFTGILIVALTAILDNVLSEEFRHGFDPMEAFYYGYGDYDHEYGRYSRKSRRHSHRHSRRHSRRHSHKHDSSGGRNDDYDNAEDWSQVSGTIHKKCIHSGMVALTFDDGVVGETSQILDILSKNGVKATFFIVGYTIEGNPMYHKVLRRILDEGHTLGTHTYSHADLTSLGADGIKYELENAGKLIQQASGERPRILRPPYGSVNNEMMRVVSNLGYEVVNWNLDTNDWRTPYDTTPIIDSLYQNDYGHDSKIVLMHDKPITVQALETIIKFYRKKGMSFVNMEQCLGIGGYF